MKIAVIGAGNVGRALGKGWAKKGHSVVFGVRDPNSSEIKTLLRECGANARASSVAEASEAADVVVLATPWAAVQDVIRTAGGLKDKVVFDCINPLKADLSGLDVANTSAAEQIAAWAPQARVVKVFNTTGSTNMENSQYPDGPVTMFYCGDDAEAKKVAAQLASDLGFEAVDAGGLQIARLLEQHAMLWIHLALRQGFGRDFA